MSSFPYTVGNADDEVGRYLLPHELTEKTIVCLGRSKAAEEPPYWITLWVYKIWSDQITFMAGGQKAWDIPIYFTVWRSESGVLVDGAGHHIYVREYLGRP